MFLAPWLFLIEVEIKANVVTSLLEQLLILIAQGQTQILPNTWNLLKSLKNKKEIFQPCKVWRSNQAV